MPSERMPRKRYVPTGRAKDLRRDKTKPEALVLEQLRGHRFEGLKFKRQVIIGPYVADFCCEARKIIIEIDGSHHHDEIDAARTKFLELKGYRVIRYSNDYIFNHLNYFTDDLRHKLGLPLS
jgi:very-short-patch-repair endonuclease